MNTKTNLTSRIIQGAIGWLGTAAAMLLIAATLVACGTPMPQAAVSGTVSYPQTVDQAPGTVVIVQIQDISKADAPAVVVGEQRISNPGPVPIAFSVGYDPAAIDDNHTYIVHARVEDGSGKLLYTTMQHYAVISQGHPTQNVSMNLELVGGQ